MEKGKCNNISFELINKKVEREGKNKGGNRNKNKRKENALAYYLSCFVIAHMIKTAGFCLSKLS